MAPGAASGNEEWERKNLPAVAEMGTDEDTL
jgi:hypothetical protein